MAARRPLSKTAASSATADSDTVATTNMVQNIRQQLVAQQRNKMVGFDPQELEDVLALASKSDPIMDKYKDPTTRRSIPGINIKGIVEGFNTFTSANSEYVRCQLRVMLDKPFDREKVVTITKDEDGSLVREPGSNKLVLRLNHWVRLTLEEYAKRRKTTKYNIEVKKKDYFYVVEDATPERIEHGQVITVNWTRKSKDAKDLQFKQREPVQLFGIKKMTTFNKKTGEGYTTIEVANVKSDTTSPPSNPDELFEMTRTLAYSNPRFYRVKLMSEEEFQKEQQKKHPQGTAPAHPEANVVNEIHPEVGLMQDETAAKGAAAGTAAGGGASGNAPARADKNAARAEISARTKAMRARLPAHIRSVVDKVVWFTTSPSDVKVDDLISNNHIIQLVMPPTFLDVTSKDGWLGTRKEGDSNINFPVVHFTSRLIQRRHKGDAEDFQQCVYFSVTLYSDAQKRFGIANSDVAAELLRYLITKTPFTGNGWVDLLGTRAQEVENPIPSSNGTENFRIEIGSNTVFVQPVAGIINSCLEVSAEFAHGVRLTTLMQEVVREDPNAEPTYTVRKEMEGFIKENPWNQTGEVHPMVVNFTESNIDPLNVRDKYRFFLLLAFEKTQRHTETINKWIDLYGREKAIKIVEAVLESNGSYEEDAGDGKVEIFVLKDIHSQNAGPKGLKQVFGIRNDAYDKYMARLAPTPAPAPAPAPAAAPASEPTNMDTTPGAEPASSAPPTPQTKKRVNDDTEVQEEKPKQKLLKAGAGATPKNSKPKQ